MQDSLSLNTGGEYIRAIESGHQFGDKHRLRTRGHRIEGQAAGIVRMSEQDRPCAELLQQIAALTAGADKLAFC